MLGLGREGRVDDGVLVVFLCVFMVVMEVYRCILFYLESDKGKDNCYIVCIVLGKSFLWLFGGVLVVLGCFIVFMIWMFKCSFKYKLIGFFV